jgi:predicted Rdx family selenoprotein
LTINISLTYVANIDYVLFHKDTTCHFEISCLATLFYNKKSMKVKKKFGRIHNQKKLKHLKKFVKKIAILIYPPFLEKKVDQKTHQKLFF